MTKKKSPILSDAEVMIMSILWDKKEANVQEVCECLEKKVAYTTVATVLGILEKKQYVSHKVEKRTYIYKPLLSRDEVGQFTLKYIATKFFKGSYQKLVANLVNHDELSQENLVELKDIIDNAVRDES